ncbi:hypothetical protein [Plantibacter sp. RU18]|uniref:hypothetical protein n=1 Tax=Plantibacter sp. RU18 TaxID=3158143 RepID=UPI002D06CEA4|nr:hypothetical protein [Gemmatimonadaceae bacterium]
MKSDDELHAFLNGRGWWSRREHARSNGYRPTFDAWGWGGHYPGSIDIRCVDTEQYEVSWKRASTNEPVLEIVSGRRQLQDRIPALESMPDVFVN